MLYEYRCDSCGTFQSADRADRAPCQTCGLVASRRYGFRVARSTFSGGYNPSVGAHVGSMGELKSHFSRLSDEQSRLTGQPVDIQPIDYSDRAAVGITDADVDRMTEEKAKAGIR